jgi:hypothetical protein
MPNLAMAIAQPDGGQESSRSEPYDRFYRRGSACHPAVQPFCRGRVGPRPTRRGIAPPTSDRAESSQFFNLNYVRDGSNPVKGCCEYAREAQNRSRCPPDRGTVYRRGGLGGHAAQPGNWNGRARCRAGHGSTDSRRYQACDAGWGQELRYARFRE